TQRPYRSQSRFRVPRSTPSVQKGNHYHRGDDYRAYNTEIPGEAGNFRHVFAEIKSCKAPNQNPQRTSERVENKKPPPIHIQSASDNTVQLAQNVYKPGESDGRRAESRKDFFDFLQAMRGEANFFAVSQNSSATEDLPDHIPNVVAQHCSKPREKQQGRKRNISSSGKYGGDN